MQTLHTLIRRLRSADEHTRVLLLYFQLVSAGLLLGDGKQGVIEVYITAVVLFLWFYRSRTANREPAALPRPVGLAWNALFAATLISVPFSDSIGYSVSAFVRLAGGYLIYRLFYDLSGGGFVRRFADGFLFMVALSAAVSVLYPFLPFLSYILPSMNLVRVSYGHNHLADLLLFVSPLVLSRTLGIGTLWGGVGLAVFSLLLFATRARTAWVMVSVYMTAAALRSKIRPGKKLMISLCVSGVLLLLFVLAAARHYTANRQAFELFARPSSLSVRVEYWRQAWTGFLSRPLVGRGPGTFSLISLKHQRAPLHSSWFAHSQPLQVLAETGLIGIAAYAYFVAAHLFTWYRTRRVIAENPNLVALAMGTGLVFLYGLFDFVLDYFLVWLLFCSVAGLVTAAGRQVRRERTGRVSVLPYVLALFYLLWTASYTVRFFFNRPELPFLIAPFDAPQALLYIEDTSIVKEPHQIDAAVFFHRSNAQILLAASEYATAMGYADGERYVRLAAYADPQNMDLVKRHLTYVVKNFADPAGRDFLRLLDAALPPRFHPQVDELYWHPKVIGAALKRLFEESPPRLSNGYASLLYLIGYEAIGTTPELTRWLWTLARDLKPDYAPFHIELARYYQRVELDDAKAQGVLRSCAAITSAAAQCRRFMHTGLLPPGDFYDSLR